MEKAYIICLNILSDQSGKKIIDALSFFKKWWLCNDHVYIIKTESTAKDIKNYLKVFLEENDKLTIFGLDGEGEWVGLDDKESGWLTNFVLL